MTGDVYAVLAAGTRLQGYVSDECGTTIVHTRRVQALHMLAVSPVVSIVEWRGRHWLVMTSDVIDVQQVELVFEEV